MKDREFTRSDRLMGSDFSFKIVAPLEEPEGERMLDLAINEIRRIEALLTEFEYDSETSQINLHSSEKPVRVSAEVFELLKRSLEISKLTDGAFDITAGALKKLYRFNGEIFSPPAASLIKQALQKTGFQKILLRDDSTVQFQTRGMQISFAAIGKGYAADRARHLLEKAGIKNGVINASGDLTAWGSRADGVPWKVGITNPADPQKILCWLPLNGQSVATSGNYVQYFDLNGKRYSHNINPKTGIPVDGIRSTTVISPSAELSDALATAFTVMGAETGIFLAAQLPHTHVIMVDDRNRIHLSKKIKIGHAA